MEDIHRQFFGMLTGVLIAKSFAQVGALKPINNLPSCRDDAYTHCVRPYQEAGDILTLEGVPAELFAGGKQKRWDKLPDIPPWYPDSRTQRLKAAHAKDNSLALCTMMGDEEPEDIVEWLQYHWCVSFFRIAKGICIL